MTERILITGATGFIGSAVCRALIAQGRQVRALHRPTSSLAALEDLKAAHLPQIRHLQSQARRLQCEIDGKEMEF